MAIKKNKNTRHITVLNLNNIQSTILYIAIGVIFLVIPINIFLFHFHSTIPSSITSASNTWANDYSNIAAMENYKSWDTYNVHDPACKKVGDTYYMYSTDAIFAENKKDAKEKDVPLGFIQMRKSKDLVNLEFIGWAFPEIPIASINWFHSHADGKWASNIWAPY